MMTSASAARDPGSERRVGLGLAVLLAVVFALRLLYAGSELQASRFYDERFSFRNVSELLVRGSLRPNNAYYPSLSFLPQTLVLGASEGLHRLTGSERLSIFDPERDDGYSATAYLLARSVAAIFGTLSVWLTFLLGRRLFSPAAGLVAAALLGATWSHVRHSAMFKPDILVVMLTLVAFRWSLDAALRPTLRRFLIAGLGVGLVASAKYNGVGVAIPLAVAAVSSGWRDRRQWVWLAAAGLTAAVTFVAMNPDLPLVWEYVGRQQALYEERGTIQGGSHASVLLEEARFLLRQHGWVILAFAAAGACGLAARLRPQRGDRRHLEALLVLGLVFGYSGFYAASTTLFRGQNYLLVTPFITLLAGWTMVGLWSFLVARFRLVRFRPLAVAVWAAVLVLAFRFPVVMIYRQIVPSTAELAERYLASQLRPPELRQITYERLAGSVRPFREGRLMAAAAVERLAEVPADELDRADAEVFPAVRLDGPEADFYLRRLADRRGMVQRFRPGRLSARGPGLVVILHGWSLRGRPRPLRFVSGGVERRFRSRLPAELVPGETVSLSLLLPRSEGSRPPFRLRCGGRSIAAFETHVRGSRALYLTPRIELAADRELIVDYDRALGTARPPEGELCRWQEPG